jgi:hypothetical protein
MRILNTGVTSKTIDGRVSMDCISSTNNPLLLIFVCPNFVDEPFADASYLKRDAIVAYQILDSFFVLFLRGQPSLMRWFPAGLLEQDHDPLGPRFDHSHDDEPPPFRSVGLHDPMEIANSVSDMVGQVSINHDIQGERQSRGS